MKQVLATALAFGLLAGSASAASAVYSNPVMAGDYPDPSVIRVGKDYWATATSSEWSPQFPILHSTDLVNWEVVGQVFDQMPKWASGNFWAPEITSYNRNYYVYYVARKKGGPLSVGVAAASRPQGPYADYGPLVSQEAGSIDPVFCKDENGDPYLIWKEDGNSRKQPCILWAQRLSENGIQLIGERKELLRNDAPWEGAVIEGPYIVQRGDYFYLFYSGNGCCGLNCNYALGVARSRKLLGPWEKNPGNPILAGNDTWKCPGHGTIVQDEDRRYWLMYHAYNAGSFVFTGREALLDEVKFTPEGWAEINLGMGPSSREQSPHGKSQKRQELAFSDAFTAGKLRPGWNWPVSDESPASQTAGRLTLVASSEWGTNLMGGVLGRSITAGDFFATTTVFRNTVDAGEIAGLAVLGDRANSTGVAYVDERIILWNRTRNQQTILAEAEAPAKSRILHFRVIAGGGRQYQFSFSGDGREWTDIAPQTSGAHLPPWDRAIRVGMTVGGAHQAEASFDSFEIQPIYP